MYGVKAPTLHNNITFRWSYNGCFKTLETWSFQRVNKSKIFVICIIKENQKFHIIRSICIYPVCHIYFVLFVQKIIELPIQPEMCFSPLIIYLLYIYISKARSVFSNKKGAHRIIKRFLGQFGSKVPTARKTFRRSCM